MKKKNLETKEKLIKSEKVDIHYEPASFEKHDHCGLFIGALESNQGAPILWNIDTEHVFIFAPTSSGKNIGMPIIV